MRLANMINEYCGQMRSAGKKGEDFIESYLKSKYGFENVERLTEDSHYFKKDIDFRVVNNGNVHLIEVKTDSRINETGNIPFEFLRIYFRDFTTYEGWGFRSEATGLIIKEDKSTVIYCFDFASLREDVRKYLLKIKGKVRVATVMSNSQEIITEPSSKNDIKLTFNLLIPLKEVRHKKIDVTPSYMEGFFNATLCVNR